MCVQTWDRNSAVCVGVNHIHNYRTHGYEIEHDCDSPGQIIVFRVPETGGIFFRTVPGKT